MIIYAKAGKIMSHSCHSFFNIDNIIKQTYAAWLTDSNRDIEAEWEDYVDSIYKIGLTQNLEIRQAAYDKYIESVK